MVTDRHTHRQTHKPTPVNTYSLAFTGRIRIVTVYCMRQRAKATVLDCLCLYDG